MSLFQSLILFDVIAIAIIAATIYALSISHPADETRSETAAAVEAIVNRVWLRKFRRARISFDQVAHPPLSAGRAARSRATPSDQTA